MKGGALPAARSQEAMPRGVTRDGAAGGRGDVAEAEEIQAILADAGIDSAARDRRRARSARDRRRAAEGARRRVELEAAHDAIEALTEPDELTDD